MDKREVERGPEKGRRETQHVVDELPEQGNVVKQGDAWDHALDHCKGGHREYPEVDGLPSLRSEEHECDATNAELQDLFNPGKTVFADDRKPVVAVEGLLLTDAQIGDVEARILADLPFNC